MPSLLVPIVLNIAFLVLVHAISEFLKIKLLASSVISFVFAEPILELIVVLVVFIKVISSTVLEALKIVHFLVLVHLH